MSTKWVDPHGQKPYYFLGSVTDISGNAEPDRSEQVYQLSALKSGAVTHILLDFKMDSNKLAPLPTNKKGGGHPRTDKEAESIIQSYLQQKVRITLESGSSKAIGVFDLDPADLVSYGDAKNLYVARLKTPNQLSVTENEALIIRVRDKENQVRIPRASRLFLFGLQFQISSSNKKTQDIKHQTIAKGMTTNMSSQRRYAGLSIQEFDYGVEIQEDQGQRPMYRTQSSRNSQFHPANSGEPTRRLEEANYIPDDIRDGSRYFDNAQQLLPPPIQTSRLGKYHEKYHKDPLNENRSVLRLYDPRPEGTPLPIYPSQYWKKDAYEQEYLEKEEEEGGRLPRFSSGNSSSQSKTRMITAITEEQPRNYELTIDKVINFLIFLAVMYAAGTLLYKKYKTSKQSGGSS
jgi:hypothetical protein